MHLNFLAIAKNYNTKTKFSFITIAKQFHNFCRKAKLKPAVNSISINKGFNKAFRKYFEVYC